MTTSSHISTAADDWAVAASRRLDSLFAHIDRALDHLRQTNTELARFAIYER